MSNPIQTIIQFVLEKSENEPLARRAELYRALTQIVPDEASGRKLMDLANSLNQIEAQSQQLTLDLRLGKDGQK